MIISKLFISILFPSFYDYDIVMIRINKMCVKFGYYLWKHNINDLLYDVLIFVPFFSFMGRLVAILPGCGAIC